MGRVTEEHQIEEFTDYVLRMQSLKFEHRDFEKSDGSLGKLGQSLNDLAEIMDRCYQEQGRLLDITEKINQGIFLSDVLDHVYDTFRPIIPYDRIGFALLEDGGRVVRSHWARSDAANIKLADGYAQKLEDSSLEQVVLTEKPRIINDLEAYYVEHPDSHSTQLILAEGIRSSLTCPLIAMGEPVGFIFFSSMEKSTYEDIHQDLFRRIASQLAVIVEKSRLYENLCQLNNELIETQKKLQHQATHDSLTELWNRRAILDVLEKELARAQRAQEAAAVIMIDIDHFKRTNDKHGHQIGDQVLREVARRLEEIARRGDTVGRFGGEEFLVVLSRTSAPGARIAAERYRAQIAAKPIEVDSRQIQITASLGAGVAMSVNGISGKTLIKLADDALYTAKASGRNRVEINAAEASREDENPAPENYPKQLRANAAKNAEF
ncbi:MAG: sensor domain-containing diguanylate cyclase [Candidatus Hydrogenedentes bacterium]|nr:sensor domain-containing diguanylate cyclase [Candidatus Hydrogenedentota bacterium]